MHAARYALLLLYSLSCFAQDAEVENKVNSLLAQMTLEEKVLLLGGKGFYTQEIKRLGVPSLKMGDGPVGVRNWGPATLYPATILLAATWNERLAERFGHSLGRDSRARGMHISLAPSVNIYRSPLCGRNYEYMGEDPFLAGRLAAASIKAVQSHSVAATIKHFAANNSETRRSYISNDIDERALREIYLPAYEMAVKEANVWCIMNAYNMLNGSHCTENSWLNNTLLKGEWKFKGVVMSDWNATHTTLEAALGGLDLEMPNQNYFKGEKLKPFIEDGKVSVHVIDDKVRRLLRLMVANGWLGSNQEDKSIPLDDPESAATSLAVAREGIVLLKNEKQVLPLDITKVKSIAVLGPNANRVVTGLGSGNVTPFHSVSILDGIKQRAGGIKIIEIPWEEPTEYLENSKYNPGLTREVYNSSKAKKPLETKTVNKIEVSWDKKNPSMGITATDGFFGRWSGTVTAPADGSYQFIIKATDINVRAYIDGKLHWESVREATGSFLINLKANQAHQLKIEADQRKKNVSFDLKLGWGPAKPVISARNINALKTADAAIVCVGFNVITGEGEGYDRSYTLQGRQEELILEATKVNTNTIVALNCGGSVATENWIDKIPVFMHTFYPGQEGGKAFAEVLFGDISPSGHLPFSYEKRWEDCAAYENYPKDYLDGSIKNISYKEGVFLGYRWFNKKGIKPLFPFGHGLSYTEFTYSDLATAEHDNKILVTFNVTNTGKRAGAEVVQVYVGQPGASVERPVRELKGFNKAMLQPGEKKSVSILLDKRAFSFFHPEKKAWVIEPGKFTIEAGASAEDIKLKKQLNVNFTF